MKSRFGDLYDYATVRQITEGAVMVPATSRATLVLGSSQADDILRFDLDPSIPVRRRRGGGGVVLVDEGDLWVDFWVPVSDPRYTPDVVATALQIGKWWSDAIGELSSADLDIENRPLRPSSASVACFGSIGRGEISLAGKKVLGLTQWRVREGCLVSTLVRARTSEELVGYLQSPPDNLASSLHHGTLDTLGLQGHRAALTASLMTVSGPWNSGPRPLL